jgi:hypothetical protein
MGSRHLSSQKLKLPAVQVAEARKLREEESPGIVAPGSIWRAAH